MISNSYSQNLFFAHSALSLIKRDFKKGSTNRPGDKEHPKFQQASASIEASLDYWHNKTNTTVFKIDPSYPHFEEYFILDTMFFGASHGIHGGGNCGAKTSAAFGYLFLCNIKPVAYASLAAGEGKEGHDFLIIGDINKPNEAIVCDLHFEECYQLARFRDYTAAKHFGTSIEIGWQCRKEYDEQSITKLCGVAPIHIDKIQEKISRFFAVKFMEYLNEGKVLFNLGNSNFSITPPAITFSTKTREFVVPTNEMQRVYQFEEVSVMAREYQKGTRIR